MGHHERPAAESPSIADVIALLQSTLVLVQSEVGALDRTQMAATPAPMEWCVNEVIGHLIEAEERGFAGRIRQIIDQDHPQLAGWDQPAVARGRHDCERDGAELMREFAQVRTASLELVECLRPEQLVRTGYHPVVGELSIQDLLYEWAYHDRDHLRQLLANVQWLLWPWMGGARGFYG